MAAPVQSYTFYSEARPMRHSLKYAGTPVLGGCGDLGTNVEMARDSIYLCSVLVYVVML